jgi:hypothetical protein
MVGLVGLIDDYGILRRDLLIQRLLLDSNDAFEKRHGQQLLAHAHDDCGATHHSSLRPQPRKSGEYQCMVVAGVEKRYPAMIQG